MNQTISHQAFKSFRASTPVRNWCKTGQIYQDLMHEGGWSLALCVEEARRFSTREEWEEKSPISYRKAIKRGWLTKCTTHIVGFKRKPTVPEVWTIEMCAEMAKQCLTRAQFKKTFSYPYEKCRRNGWLDICCAHMK